MNELRLLVAGGFIWLALAMQFLLLVLFWPAQAGPMVIGLTAELLTGREGGLPAGLAAGYHPMLAWVTSFMQDLGTALLGYPVFLWLLHHYHDRDWYLMRRLRAIEAKAAAHQKYVERWGPFGIGAFMLVPFLVNGPFIGLIVGRIAGIPSRKLLGPVIIATIVTAAIWTFFIDQMLRLLESVDPRLGYVSAGLAVWVVLMLGIWDYMREGKKPTDEQPITRGEGEGKDA